MNTPFKRFPLTDKSILPQVHLSVFIFSYSAGHSFTNLNVLIYPMMIIKFVASEYDSAHSNLMFEVLIPNTIQVHKTIELWICTRVVNI